MNQPKTPPNRSGRRSSLRDFVVIGWLVALFAVIFVHRWVPEAMWLMIHLVLLGALTHSAMVWSEYFAHTLLRTGQGAQEKKNQNRRILILVAGTLMVFIGVPAGQWWLVVAGGILITSAVIWHGAYLYRQLKKALPARFQIVVHYYVAASFMLPIGVFLGVLMARNPEEPWYGQFLMAHIAVNFLGWIGLTVVGTLVTLWPTMLRARMDERAEKLATRALPVLLLGIAVIVGATLLGAMKMALAGLVVYFAGLVIWGIALGKPLRAKGLREFAPASVLAAMFWAVVGLVWVGVILATSTNWAQVTAALPLIGGVFAAGFAIQLLFGALTYLMPSVMGGGTRVVHAGQSALHKWTTFRILVPNVALALWLVVSASWGKVALSVVGVLVLAMFVPFLVIAGKRCAAMLRDKSTGAALPEFDVPATWSWNGVVAAVAVIVLSVTAGVAVDPGAAGFQPHGGTNSSGTGIMATGQDTRVEVTIEGMHFVPSRIEVPAGNRLIVEFKNTGSDVHNLVVGDARTPRLTPGESHTLEAGVISHDVEAFCSVAGHRQMGMVLDVVAVGALAGNSMTGGDHAGHTPMSTGQIQNVPGAKLQDHIDPKLPKLGSERVHKHRFEATEVPNEVAPGLWQTRWTFNGKSVGPTLHGRVGDVFEITLVNNGSMGHSIDFHAGALAPDLPMRTIAPGEELVYRFKATRAGIWMYHCGTMPMTSHIAMGMHGAVVIKPEGLPEVDHEYVLTQSEVYLANKARSAGEAQELDSKKLAEERPDRVVFNGIANQYDQQPFRVKVGQRVRFWVLDAGPNRALSFHIVGGQFDTSWTEGHYTLNRGVSADGATDGGAQVLPLLPAQGGFVELTFPEAGHYAVVNHVMIDAERGAHGIVEVTDR
ncbi:Copper-containing nitrite reductase [Corynebacterium pseudotuberculosis]|uniref:multicopper oxidase domain-containing protein n=1 Tax=Corynebacterium pseudotuberculosis TaxID=1719 RepID=UPI00097AA3A2|nr:multicopper oxidase domain-containing protein [Corynebacterium pseudotuberculosis]ATV79344.1 Copper-containing nitrite reductase [Corynebacterium pseudotuberculosis]WAF18347.1 multicopper oxidase domain-containing protein [Corynebacterium pseudotuberculosis]WAF28595.1 multicopper oxidase domain-containing protein [Corynebacterium pseudotuberculosis]